MHLVWATFYGWLVFSQFPDGFAMLGMGVIIASGVAVLVTTHYLDEAEHCQRIAIIQAGRLAAHGTVGELRHLT